MQITLNNTDYYSNLQLFIYCAIYKTKSLAQFLNYHNMLVYYDGETTTTTLQQLRICDLKGGSCVSIKHVNAKQMTKRLIVELNID